MFPALTVREAIAVALELHIGVKNAVLAAAWMPSVRRSERRVARRVEALIDTVHLSAYRDKFVGELSTGTRRMVDMACIMAAEPRLLLLDEPSSGLAQAEVEVLGPVIRRLAREMGCGVLVIEHDLPLISGLADRLIAMELGAVIAEGSPESVIGHPDVVRAYLGASQSSIERSGNALSTALANAGLVGASDSSDEMPAGRNTSQPTEKEAKGWS
jgi:branched-chain amino acid transport system ATP-binding protein